MKQDPKLKKRLIVNTKERGQQYAEAFNKYIEKLNSAKDVEHIMIAKKDFLLSLICLLPTESVDCYFCLANAIKSEPYVDCDSCEYAKIHGACRNPGSDWMELNKVQYQLVSLIRGKYYRGEEYKNGN